MPEKATLALLVQPASAHSMGVLCLRLLICTPVTRCLDQLAPRLKAPCYQDCGCCQHIITHCVSHCLYVCCCSTPLTPSLNLFSLQQQAACSK